MNHVISMTEPSMRNCLTILFCLVLIAPFGCGRKPVESQIVGGRVWYRGEPMSGGMIVFVPDEDRGNNGPLIKGEVQSDGTFAFDGPVHSGWYRVAVAPQPNAGTLMPTAAAPYPTVPARYRNPQLSGLSGEVKPAGESTFEFTLSDS